MSQKRISLEIWAEILDLCKKEQTKTRIMYKTNLSYCMLRNHLSQLQELGLLELHHSNIKYKTSPKGLDFIQKWRELEKYLTKPQARLSSLLSR